MDQAYETLEPSDAIRARQLAWVEKLAQDFGYSPVDLKDPAFFPDPVETESVQHLKQLTRRIKEKAYMLRDETSKQDVAAGTTPLRYASFQPEAMRMMDAMFDEYLLAWHWRRLAEKDAKNDPETLNKRMAMIDAIEATTAEYYLSRMLEILPSHRRNPREATSVVGVGIGRFIAAMNMTDGMGVDEDAGYKINPEIRKVLPKDQQTPGNIIHAIIHRARTTDEVASRYL